MPSDTESESSETHLSKKDQSMHHVSNSLLLDSDIGNKSYLKVQLVDAAVSGNIVEIRRLIQLGANVSWEDAKKMNALHFAAQSGNKEAAELLLNHDAAVDARNEASFTALHLAAENGHKEVINLLLNCGADVDALNEASFTALHLAAENGHKEVINLLLNCGADVNAENDDSVTALHLAAEDGHKEVVSLLMMHGAAVDARNEELNSALHSAARNGHKDVVDLLIEHGAVVDATNEKLNTPLHWAAAGGHKDVVNLLIEHGAAVDASNENSETALHKAVENRHKEVVDLLINHGAAVDARNEHSFTALHIAAEKGHTEIIQLLLNSSASVDVKDDYWNTSLHLAAKWGHQDVITLLLHHGATADLLNYYSQTALHLATQSGSISVKAILLEQRATINQADEDGRTPLHIATEKEHKNLVQLLFDHGAAIDNVDKDGRTPLHIAAEKGDIYFVHLLLHYGAAIDNMDNHRRTPLHIAVEKGDRVLVLLLLERGAAIEVKDSNLRTPLHLAAFSSNDVVVSLLLERGANVYAADKIGRTPLHLATQRGFQEVLTILPECESDPNKADSGGCTARQIAAEHSHLKVTRTLLDHGAEVNKTDKNGWTALHIAANYGSLEITKILLAFGANLHAINLEGYTLLDIAVFSGYTDMVSFLLDTGATKGGRSAVMIPKLAKVAARTGHTDILNMVLGHQIDTKQNYKYRHDYLYPAVALGYLDIVSLLLEGGNVDLEKLDYNGMTPLFSAADYPEIIALLVDGSANINARCPQRDNITVLHHYIQLGKIKAVNLLLNCGCNVEPIDDNGYTPLHYAVSKNNSAAVELLIHRGINMDIRNKYGSTAFYTAVECDNLKLVELLIDCDANVDAATYRISMTPLQCAIQRNNVSIIQLLLHHNVNVNVKGVHEDSPLHTAVRTGKDDIVSMLLRQDVDVNALNSSGHTPLDLALLDSNIVISQLLTKAGAELGENVSQHLYTRRFQSSHGNAPSLEEGSQEEDDAWLKWVPGDGIQSFEYANISDTQRLGAILNEYIQGLSLFKESIFQDNQDRYYEDQSFTHARSDKHSKQQTQPLSGDRSTSSSRMEFDQLENELVNSVSNTAVDTVTEYFNSTLDRVTSEWASKVIEYLIEWCGVTLFYNKSLFVLRLNSEPDGPSPPWMSQFNKMSIIRESELLVVPRSKETMYFSIPGWYDHDYVLIQFINAVYVCRMASLKVSSQVFSEVLGCVEENISDPLRGTLIAGLAILGLRGGDYSADKLVTAILSVYAKPVDTTQLTQCIAQRVLHERTCNCGSSNEHRPLSPIAAAKSVGILVWHPRDEKRILPRVWDLHTDTLVKNIDVRQVYFITHRWCENEIEYKDIMEKSAHEGRDPAEMMGISTFSTKLQRIRSVIARHARYVWIDTICMDRYDLSELDMAIHSMYEWYSNCHAVVLDSDTSLNVWKSRGWCLQEGVAAGLIYGILEKDSKEELVSMQELAHAQRERLCELDLSLYYRPGNATEILARMDARRTTRVEDMSYALIGIFSIHIQLNYGEQWDARTKVLRELATKKGDLSILSFATTKENAGKYLPLPNEKPFLVAECAPAKTPITFNRLGVTIEAQLVSIVEFQSTLDVLKRWMKLLMNQTKSFGLDRLISAAEQIDVRNSKYIEVAIVHSIRSLMLVEIHDDEQYMDGSQAYISCHRLQCCQFEHQEFEQLFADINVSQQTIFIKGENVELIEDNDDEEQPLTTLSLNVNARPETPSFSDDEAPNSNSQECVFRIKKSHQGQEYSFVGIRESVDNIKTSTIVKRSTERSTIDRLLTNSTNSEESSESKEDDSRTTKLIGSWHYKENRNDADDNRNYHVLVLVSKSQYSLGDIVEMFTAIGAALNDHTVQRLEIRHAQHDNSYPSPVNLAATVFHYVMLNSKLAENIFTEAKEYMTGINYALFEVHRGNQNMAIRMRKSNYRLDDMLKDVLMSEETDIVNHSVEIINTPTLLAFLEVYCQPEFREFRKEMKTCTDRVSLSLDHTTSLYYKHYSFTGLEDNHIKITADVHDGDSILPTDIEHATGERDLLLNRLDDNGIVAIKMSTELVKGKKSDVYMLAKKHLLSYHCLLYCTLNPGAIALLNLLGSETKEIVVAGNSDIPYPSKPHYKCYQYGVKNKRVNTFSHIDQVGNSIQPRLFQRHTSDGTYARILYDPKLKDTKLSLNMSVSTNDLFIICLNRLMAAYNARPETPVIPKISYAEEFKMRNENVNFRRLIDAYKVTTIKLCYTEDAVHIYPIQSFQYLNSVKEGESSRHTRWLVRNVHFYRKALKDLVGRETEAADSLEHRTKALIGVIKTATKGVPFVDIGAAIETAALIWKKKVGDLNRHAVAKELSRIHSALVEQATFSPTSMLLTYRHNSDFVKESMTGEYMRFIGPEDDFTGPLPPYYKFRVYQLALIGAKYTWVNMGMMSEIAAQSICQGDEKMYVAFFDEEDEEGEDDEVKKRRVVQFSIAEATEGKDFGESMLTEDFIA